jgi:hypothetical protein
MALDPANNVIDRIRINVGDVDVPYILEDALYQYFLDSNANDEYKSSVQALEAIVAKYAKYVHEKVDGEEEWGQEAYDNYRKLLDTWKNNPSYIGAWSPYAGGISKSDLEANRQNSDANLNPFEVGGNACDQKSIWE